MLSSSSSNYFYPIEDLPMAWSAVTSSAAHAQPVADAWESMESLFPPAPPRALAGSSGALSRSSDYHSAATSVAPAPHESLYAAIASAAHQAAHPQPLQPVSLFDSVAWSQLQQPSPFHQQLLQQQQQQQTQQLHQSEQHSQRLPGGAVFEDEDDNAVAAALGDGGDGGDGDGDGDGDDEELSVFGDGDDETDAVLDGPATSGVAASDAAGRKLERNRRAAQQFRKRQKLLIEQLERDVARHAAEHERLSSDVERKQAEVARARLELAELQQFLIRHTRLAVEPGARLPAGIVSRLAPLDSSSCGCEPAPASVAVLAGRRLGRRVQMPPLPHMAPAVNPCHDCDCEDDCCY